MMVNHETFFINICGIIYKHVLTVKFCMVVIMKILFIDIMWYDVQKYIISEVLYMVLKFVC